MLHGPKIAPVRKIKLRIINEEEDILKKKRLASE
jgi:hypothetical protein